MQICDISVEGFRSLFNVSFVPIKNQTIITGQNDGGKSALLDALNFLISGKEPSEHDLSQLSAAPSDSDDQQPAVTVKQIVVTGTFQLSQSERVELGLSELVKIRRRYSPDEGSHLEVRMSVCEVEELRNIESEKIARLKEVAAKYNIQPVGRANARESWTTPLARLAEGMPTVEEWVPVSNALAGRLPVVVYFKGDAVQAPEIVVQSILNSKLREYSKSESSQKRITELEDHLADSLVADIDHIRKHVMKRCGFSALRLNPQVQVRPSLAGVEVRVANRNGHEVPLSAAGTGRSRRISLALWESSSQVLGSNKDDEGSGGESRDTDVVFVYDEPDTHLDYEHQRRVMNLIHEQSARPNARVVVATHSMNLIDGVDIANVVHLRVSEEGTYAELLSDESKDEEVRRHLSTIATALGFRNSVLLHERFFVAVEGPSEMAAFPILFKKYAGVPIQSVGICLWDGGNNEGALKFARFLKSHKRNVAFVVDKDSRTNNKKTFRDDKLKEYGFDLQRECHYIGLPNELEDLFDDEDWAHAANELWKRKGGHEYWTPDDFAAHRGKKFSSAVLDMLKKGSDYGPKGKDVMMTGIATVITKDRIPPALTETFDILVSKAQDAGPHYWDA
ncbi:AAA family ATPase [Streptomyces sp. TRM43335]|uniref:AAA family ATPase n=1 Tax=Streptomyces taklimakanensis TaxID=2569853 RepID=A0A6G2B8Z7_9ACTN|nr:AAA family ATPase [Streptomyces taklimakanensis]MTE18741.1 AAA family ATPase [Streptomyces taklimakanensis]